MQIPAFVGLILILVVNGCGRVSNSIDRLKLDCGADVTADAHWVKILSADGQDLSGDAFEVLTWNERGQLQALERSSQGCIALRGDQDLIIRAPQMGQGLRVATEQLQDQSSLRLTDVSSGGLSVNCHQDFMRSDSNLLENIQWQGHSETDAFEVRWSILGASGANLLASDAQLLTAENHSSVRRTLPSTLPEGSYTLRLETYNFLRDQASAKGDCKITLDRLPPAQNLSWTSTRIHTHAGFVNVAPGSALNVKTQDSTGTKTLVCMSPLPDPDDASAEAVREACDWQSIPGFIAAPLSGYWNVQYKSVDAAGNESAVESQKIYAFNEQTLDIIKLMSEGVPAHIRGEGDPLQGVYNALQTETLHRSLTTVYERSLAQDFAARALYSILHKPFPYRVQTLEQGITGITVSPDEEYFVAWTLGKGLAYLYRADGTLVWKRMLDGVPNRAIFSPDSKQFAMAGQKGLVKVWSVETGEELYTFNAGGLSPWVFKYNAEGTALGFAAGNANVLFVWDMKSDQGKPNKNPPLLATNFGQARLNDFSWNEQQELTVAVGGYLAFFDANYKLKTSTQLDEMVKSVADLPNGYRLIISQNADQLAKALVPAQSAVKVSIYNPELKVLAQEILPGSLDRYRKSPDGKHFVISGNGLEGIAILQDWQTVIGQAEGGTFNGHLFISKVTPKETSAVYWSKDSSQFATISFSGELSVINVEGNLVNQILGPNPDLYGTAAILPSRNLWVTGSVKLRFWDLESHIFPSYYTQGAIAQHSMNGDQSKHLLLERNKFSYRITVLDEQLNRLQSWPWHAGSSYLEMPSKDFSSLFRSFRLLDNDQIVTADYSKNQIYRHALDGSLLSDNGTTDVRHAKASPMTAFSLWNEGHNVVVGYADGSVSGFKNREDLPYFSRPMHTAASYYLDEDMNPTAVLNVEALADDEIYTTGMDGKLIYSTSTGETSPMLTTPHYLNVARHYADGTWLLSGRGLISLFYFKDGSGKPLDIYESSDFRITTADTFRGEIFAGGYGKGLGVVRLWDSKGSLRTTLDMVYRNRVSTVNFTKDGKGLLVAAYNRLLYVPRDPNEIYRKVCARMQEQMRAEGNRDDVCVPDQHP